MEDKIRKALEESTDHQTGEIDGEIAVDKLLDLFSVSKTKLDGDRVWLKAQETSRTNFEDWFEDSF